MTKLKADVVLRCFRIVAAVTLLACGRCAPSIHDTHVPRRTTPLSRDNARLSFEVARPPFLIFYFGFEEIAEKFRRGVGHKVHNCQLPAPVPRSLPRRGSARRSPGHELTGSRSRSLFSLDIYLSTSLDRLDRQGLDSTTARRSLDSSTARQPGLNECNL